MSVPNLLSCVILCYPVLYRVTHTFKLRWFWQSSQIFEMGKLKKNIYFWQNSQIFEMGKSKGKKSFWQNSQIFEKDKLKKCVSRYVFLFWLGRNVFIDLPSYTCSRQSRLRFLRSFWVLLQWGLTRLLPTSQACQSEKCL